MRREGAAYEPRIEPELRGSWIRADGVNRLTFLSTRYWVSELTSKPFAVRFLLENYQNDLA